LTAKFDKLVQGLVSLGAKPFCAVAQNSLFVIPSRALCGEESQCRNEILRCAQNDSRRASDFCGIAFLRSRPVCQITPLKFEI
jgi:hypothetical protein